MSTNKLPASSKVNREGNNESRNDNKLEDENVRIIQDNLVFVNGLSWDIASRQNLKRNIYFGRYGKILKIILNPSIPNKKGTNYQAYVTYQSALNASLAIALDGFTIFNRSLKVSYGTTKYCSHFLRGIECFNSQCFYLHKLNRNKQILSTDTRSIFNEQNDRAAQHICEQLEEIIENIMESQMENIYEGFPTLSQVLDYLIDCQSLTQEEVDNVFDQINSRKVKKSTITNQIYTLILPDIQWQELSKSNTLSTMSVPSQKDKQVIQHCLTNKQPSNSNTCTSLQNQTEIPLQSKQTIHKQQRVQQKIYKLIIRQMLKTQCRSRFIKNAIASREECSKIRAIVQRYLIANN